jgi:hypothetical protein
MRHHYRQLADTKYRLVRTLGRVIGLGWSQTKVNPTTADLPGLALMHETDPISCVPISVCYGATGDQLKTDDRAALSRLYPVTTANLVAGKQLFCENAFRIHGSVRFIDANGRPAQPMQGVNVVAHCTIRRLDRFQEHSSPVLSRGICFAATRKIP